MLRDIKHVEYLGACARGKLSMLPSVFYSEEQGPGTCSIVCSSHMEKHSGSVQWVRSLSCVPALTPSEAFIPEH